MALLTKKRQCKLLGETFGASHGKNMNCCALHHKPGIIVSIFYYRFPSCNFQPEACVLLRAHQGVTLVNTDGGSPQVQRERERIIQSLAQGMARLEQRCLSVIFYLLSQIRETSAKIYPGSSSCWSCLLSLGNS